MMRGDPWRGGPGLLRRFLARALPDDDWSREFVAELDAEYARARARPGGRSRKGWYARQVLSPATMRFVWLARRRARRAAFRARAGAAGVPGSGPGGAWRALPQEVRQTARSLAREPRFAGFVVLTLALGIGANAAVYGVAQRLFLRGPPHVRAPSELVRLYLRLPGPDGVGERTSPWIPYRTARGVQEGSRAFAGLALYRPQEPLLGRLDEEVRPLRVATVDGGFFAVLGVLPHAGRFFEGDLDPGGAPTAVLSHALARAAFGDGRTALGRSLELEGLRHTIVAVAPEGFGGLHVERVDVWVPLDPGTAGTRNWWVVGRLPPGRAGEAAMALAAADADAIHRRTDVGPSFQWSRAGTVVAAGISSDDAGARSAESAIAGLLLGMMAVVLLIACANVVNLQLARGAHRRGEVVVRLALGIGRWRLVRLLLGESVLLALLGGLASLPVAYAGGLILRGVLLPDVAWASSPLDPGLLTMTALAALVTGVAVGVLPARHASRTELTSGLASERVGGGRGRAGVQSVLAVAQVTLSAALLLCAGLFLKSFATIRGTDLGFEADEAMALSLQSLDAGALSQGSDEERDTYGTALATVRGVRGFERAALAVGLPFVHTFGRSIHVPGLDSIPALPGGGPYLTAVTGGYFEAVGTPILRGSPISDEDVAREEPVIVVSESMARALWPGGDALGGCVRVGTETSPCSRVIGVAADVHRTGYREPPSMQFYIPLGQESGFGGMALVVRSSRWGSAEMDRLRGAVAGLLPSVHHVELASLRSLLEPQIRPWRLGAVVLSLAGCFALLVSLVGVYGVVSYLVARRRREIGVRKALGASRVSIQGLVLRAGALSGVAGVAVGVTLVLAASPWLEPLLFETRVADATVIVGVSGALMAAAVLACLLPAGQAARVDPVICLRGES